MDHDGRRERASELVAALNLPRPLTAERLHRHMEELRHNRIVVRAASARMIESGVCGLWIEVDGEDFERIYFAPTESAVHRQQFINHEFGHMILDGEKELLTIDRVALLAPLIPYGAIVHALSRSSFTEEQEALAEAIGDCLALMMLADRTDVLHGLQTGFGRVL